MAPLQYIPPRLYNILIVGITVPKSNHISYTTVKSTQIHKYIQTYMNKTQNKRKPKWKRKTKLLKHTKKAKENKEKQELTNQRNKTHNKNISLTNKKYLK